MLTRMAPLLTRMARMVRMLTRMTRWLAYYTNSLHLSFGKKEISKVLILVSFPFSF